MRRMAMVLAAAGSVLLIPIVAHATTGTVSGTVTALPATVAPEGVEAISSRGVIGGVGPLSAAGSYSLKLPAGTWIIETSSESDNGPLTSLSAPVRVRAHGTTTVKPAGAKAEAASASGRALKSGSTVTVLPIELQDERDFTTPSVSFVYYTVTVTNDLFRACASRGISFVDTSDTFRKFAIQEASLSKAGRLSVPFDFKPLHPKYQVGPDTGNALGDASGVVGTNEVSVRIEVTLLGGAGKAIQGPNVSQDFSSVPDSDDILSVLHKEDGALAAKMCGA